MMFSEIVAAYSENDMKHINTLCEKSAEIFNVRSICTYCSYYNCPLV
jgi:hypothetical protein